MSTVRILKPGKVRRVVNHSDGSQTLGEKSATKVEAPPEEVVEETSPVEIPAHDPAAKPAAKKPSSAKKPVASKPTAKKSTAKKKASTSKKS